MSNSFTLTSESAEVLAGVLAGYSTLATTRDLVTVEGPDAQKFLHSLVSQAVDSLPVGAQLWSFLLQPQGKVLGLFTITRSDDQKFVLSSQAGQGAIVAAQLQRYKIRTKAEISLSEGVTQSCRVTEGVALFSAASPDDVEDVDSSLFAGLRVALGIPSFGAELDDQTVPNETGFTPLAVNFKKGCYVGQELVERIDSRGGNVPKRLSWIRLATDDAAVGAGAEDAGDSDSDEAEPLRTIELTTAVSGSADSGLIGLAFADRKILARGMAQVEVDGDVTLVTVNPVSHS